MAEIRISSMTFSVPVPPSEGDIVDRLRVFSSATYGPKESVDKFCQALGAMSDGATEIVKLRDEAEERNAVLAMFVAYVEAHIDVGSNATLWPIYRRAQALLGVEK